MKDLYKAIGNRLIREYDSEIIWVEPWGKNSLRVRYSKEGKMPEDNDWALDKQHNQISEIHIGYEKASIKNGKITCCFNNDGSINFSNEKGDILLSETENNALRVPARNFKSISGGAYKVNILFKSNDNEKLYGMGQRQEPYLNLKGCELELAQRNSQVNIPFVLSNHGYGFLWNNPGYGSVCFAKNYTKWSSEVTRVVDYWITCGNTPAEIIESYTNVTGKAPMLPYFASGFWQCKLRYKNQEELLNVAREYKNRNLPISVIVIDFFHWSVQGDWCFDKNHWPNPEKMVQELKKMGIELMVSIWPTVDLKSNNYSELKRQGFLVRNERGVRVQKIFCGNEVYLDVTNPGAREYLWEKVKENYLKYGIKLFWLDEAEPEFTALDYDNVRYYSGTNLETGNLYPKFYAQAFYEGLKREGINDIVNLARCGWTGSQKYGTVIWSGDIDSSFKTLRKQVAAGLNIGISGIPWWTTDIGGFTGGDPNDENFRELFIRWFQYGTFCPIFRLHGYRRPYGKTSMYEDSGDFDIDTCGDNEVWSYGEKVYEITREFMHLREKIRPYIMELMKEAHETGIPPMRTLFLNFPYDEQTWEIEDIFMLGSDMLIAPILHSGKRSRDVYLPYGETWKEITSGIFNEGGQWINCDAPIESIPVFVKKNTKISDALYNECLN